MVEGNGDVAGREIYGNGFGAKCERGHLADHQVGERLSGQLCDLKERTKWTYSESHRVEAHENVDKGNQCDARGLVASRSITAGQTGDDDKGTEHAGDTDEEEGSTTEFLDEGCTGKSHGKIPNGKPAVDTCKLRGVGDARAAENGHQKVLHDTCTSVRGRYVNYDHERKRTVAGPLSCDADEHEH